MTRVVPISFTMSMTEERAVAVGNETRKHKRDVRLVFFLRIARKGIQVVALLILIVILLIQTHKCLAKYLSDPTYMSTKIVEQRDAEFPAMTICADSGYSYKEDVLKVRHLLAQFCGSYCVHAYSKPQKRRD